MTARLVRGLVLVLWGWMGFGGWLYAEPLRIGLWEAPEEPLHPFLLRGDDASYAASLVFSSLLTIDSAWRWHCRLCAEPPKQVSNGQTKGSNQPLQVQISLRPEGRWGDGSPITGQDLLFTWQLARQYFAKNLATSIYSSIEKVEVDANNPLLVTLTFNGRQFTYASLAELLLLPKHLEGPVWEQSKEDMGVYLQQSNYRTHPDKPGLYNGAFVVTADARPKHLRLRRNGFFGQSPAAPSKPVDEAELTFLKTEKNQLASLQMIAEPACQHLECRKLETPAQLIRGDGIGFEQIAFNLSNPVVRDVGVRKALATSIDRANLFKALPTMEVTPADSFLHPSRSLPVEPEGRYSFDMAKAAALLDGSGWMLDKATGVRSKAGKKLELELVTSELPHRKIIATQLSKEWAKIGVSISLRFVSEPYLRDVVLRKRNFVGMVLYAWRLPVDSSFGPVFHSKAIPRQRNRFQGQNVSGWFVQQVDHISDALDAHPFMPNKEKLLSELQQLYTQQLPSIPLFFYEQLARVDGRLQGVEIPGSQKPSAVTAGLWAFP